MFVLFSDRLCYMLEQCEGDSAENLLQREDSLGNSGDDDSMMVAVGLFVAHFSARMNWLFFFIL